MKNLIRLSDYTKSDVKEIFKIADAIVQGEYRNYLKGNTIVMFFPESSIRTRVTFEKGIYLLGGQTILFSPSTLDKKEEIEDVIKSEYFVGYEFKKYLLEIQQAIIIYNMK